MALICPPSLSTQYRTCPFWTCNRLKSRAGGRCRHTFDLSSLGVKGGHTPGGCWAGNKTQARLELPSREPQLRQRGSWIRCKDAEGGEPTMGWGRNRVPAVWIRASWGLVRFLRQSMGKIRQLYWEKIWSNSFANNIAKRSAVRKCWKAILMAIRESFRRNDF